jgi:hypothetical protein
MTTAQKLALASGHHQRGRLAEADAIYRQILKDEPQNPWAIHLFGVLMHQRGNTEAGIELIRRAIQIDPTAHGFYSNLGVILNDSGRLEEAAAAYHQALKFAPEDADYRWNFAINRLVAGDLEAGWEEFEWRLRSPKRNLYRGFPQPQWNGEALAGKTILLHTEGGFGDAIQFIRYVPMVVQRGGRIILECQPELERLFSQIQGIGQIVTRFNPLPHFDFQIPLQSLPKIFQTRLENIPASIPYLAAPKQSADYWNQRLTSEPGRKIGLVWAGSHGGQRSNSLEIFAPLGKIPGVRFFSLQKGPEAKQPAPAGLALIDYTDEGKDFADLSALVANLDLVISVDTSVAHLAGAMDKAVWTMVQAVPDFRWLRDREDSPWYPTMRLFRQRIGEPWAAVVERIARELQIYISETGS